VCGVWCVCAGSDAKTRFLVPWNPAVAATNNLTTDLLLTRRVPCAWPAPALAGWCCYLGVLPLRYSVGEAEQRQAHSGSRSLGAGTGTKMASPTRKLVLRGLSKGGAAPPFSACNKETKRTGGWKLSSPWISCCWRGKFTPAKCRASAFCA
jgi:hypothetical protein